MGYQTQMTAKQLAEKLLETPNAIVVAVSDDFELHGSVIPVTSIFIYKGDLVKRKFMDAFDGGSYDKEVVDYNENGKITFIKLS